MATTLRLLLILQHAFLATSLRVGSNDANLTMTPCPASSSNKDIDLVVFAATGFTGKFAAEYLANHSGGATWAIAARSPEKLSALQGQLTSSVPAPLALAADLGDYESLLRVARRARVVVSYAGPYEMLGGEALLRACLEGCAHYADVTGETPWVAEMLGKYSKVAEARGLAVVPSVGFDSLPADLLAASAAERLAADGQGPPSEVSILYTKLNSGGLSGASVASGRYMESHHAKIVDPYLLAPDVPAEARVDKIPDGPRPPFGLHKRFGVKVGTYPVAQNDLGIVRRSNAQRFPGAGIALSEYTATESINSHNVRYYADVRMLTQPPKIAFKIGDSPPVWLEERGSFAGQALAVRASDGARCRVQLSGEGSPSYLGTARLSAELALGLVVEGPSRAGFLTPSLALRGGAEAIARRLTASGFFRLEELPADLAPVKGRL